VPLRPQSVRLQVLFTSHVGGIPSDDDDGEVVVLPEHLQYGSPMSRLNLNKTDLTSPDSDTPSSELGGSQNTNSQQLQSRSHGRRNDSVAQRALQSWVSSFACALCSNSLINISRSNKICKPMKPKKHNEYNTYTNPYRELSSRMLPSELWMHKGASSFQPEQPYLVNQWQI
jgi:hypothetical protein